MKDINPKPKSVCDVFDEMCRAFVNTGRYILRTLERMSWPAILLACVLLALVFTVLPLAIMLFVIFMLVKLTIAACGGGRRDTPPPPREEPLQ